MADFKTHITTSTVLGFVYGGVGYFGFEVPLAHCMIAGSLCSVAGMLPDLDSNSGKPQREMLSFVSVIIPMMMLPRFEAIGMTTEHMIFVAGVMYVLIRFGIGGLFRRFTKHRGMWHSIPAAIDQKHSDGRQRQSGYRPGISLPQRRASESNLCLSGR